MGKWYGSLNNRIEEDRQFCNEIKIGTGVTEYHWSDRSPYEVIEVKDQKHVTVRELDHVHVGDGCMDNNWELVSNENNPTRQLEKRGDYWYWVSTITLDEYLSLPEVDGHGMPRDLRLALAGFDLEKITAKGKQTRRYRDHVSFGVASYYYDYEY